MSQTADQVQRLVQQALGEFEQLVSSDEKPSAVLARMMEALLKATQGVGAIAWMFKDPQSPDFTPVAKVGPAAPLAFDPEDKVHGPVAEVLQQSASQGKPIIVAPDQPDFQKTDLHATCQFIVPIDAMGRVLGVVQLIHSNELDPKVYRQFVMFTQQAARAAGMYLARRQSNVLREDLTASMRLLKLTHQLVKMRRPDDMIHELANLSRPILQAQRVSAVGYWKGKGHTAFSDALDVNRKAVVVRTIEMLAGVVRERKVPMVFTKGQELDPEDESLLPLLEDLYHESTSEAVVLTPMLVDKEVVGVLVAEYEDRDHASARSSSQNEVAQQAAPILEQIIAWRFRPLRLLSDALAKVRARPLTTMMKVVIVASIIAAAIYGLFFVPVPMEIYGDARLEPAHLAQVAAPQTGRVEDVHVTSGQVVAEGQLLATLDDMDLKLELAQVEQAIVGERVRLEAGRKAGDAPAVQTSQLNIEQLKIRQTLLTRQIERARIRSLIDGVVITERPERIKDMTVREGDDLLVVADLSRFDLVVEILEEDLAIIEQALREGETIDVSFLSKPWPDLVQDAKLTRIEQVSATSKANQYQTQHVFRVVVPIELKGMTPQLVLANPTGRAKLQAPPRSVAFRYGRGVWRFLQMTLFF